MVETITKNAWNSVFFSFFWCLMLILVAYSEDCFKKIKTNIDSIVGDLIKNDQKWQKLEKRGPYPADGRIICTKKQLISSRRVDTKNLKKSGQFFFVKKKKCPFFWSKLCLLLHPKNTFFLFFCNIILLLFLIN